MLQQRPLFRFHLKPRLELKFIASHLLEMLESDFSCSTARSPVIKFCWSGNAWALINLRPFLSIRRLKGDRFHFVPIASRFAGALAAWLNQRPCAVLHANLTSTACSRSREDGSTVSFQLLGDKAILSICGVCVLLCWLSLTLNNLI